MPVSASIIMINKGGGPQSMSGGGGQFARGERATSSVKLRGRRDNPEAGRKINRHSGDFSLFSSRKEAEPQTSRNEHMEDVGHEKSDSDGDDWDYITFPNGVPSIQEVKTSINHVERERNSQTPLKVTMREVPVMTQVNQRSNNTSKNITSASIVNLNSDDQYMRNFARSGDFSHFIANSEQMRSNKVPTSDYGDQRKQHARSKSQQPHKQPNNDGQHENISSIHSNLHVTPTRCPRYLQKQQTKDEGSVTKYCSSEFEFKKADRKSGDFSVISKEHSHDLDKNEEKYIMERIIKQELHGDSLSEGSEESGIFSTGSSQDSPTKYSEQCRRPGLGRRAITQINMRDRKNSYNNALAKSQENLVKVTPNGESEEVFEETPGDSNIKKGLLWQQRDKIFSRWKERYFVLTKDLLQCYKKETSKITDMGGFIFKIKLSDIESIELLDKRGYLTICISLLKEGKVFLRKTEGIRDWFNCIRENMQESKDWRKKRCSAIFSDHRQKTDSSGMENYLENNRMMKHGFSDSSPEINKFGQDLCKTVITLDELNSLYQTEEKAEIPASHNTSNHQSNKSIISVIGSTDPTDEVTVDSLEIDLERGMFPRKKFGYIDSGNNSLNTNHSTTSSSTSSKVSTGGVPCLESSFMEEDEEDYSENIRKLPSPEIRISRPQINKNIVEVRYRERSSKDNEVNKRKSSIVSSSYTPLSPEQKAERHRSHNVNRLHITHV